MRQTSRALGLILVVALTATAFAVPASAAESSVSLVRILGGYQRPLLVTHAPSGGREVFIVEQGGRIKRATYQGGSWVKLGTFLDLSGQVNDPNRSGNNERGLLGLAFHPDYQSNGRFYVNYTRRGAGAKRGDTVIAEYRRQSATKADPTSGRVVMTINQPAANHNGGHMRFGPDGLLYIATGDGGGAGDPYRNGQRLTSRLGKLLRIDPLDPDGSGPRRFRVPGGNPRVGKTGSNVIWSWGLRNPWRFSFDRASGNLWIGDVGQSAREEIDRSRSNAAGRAAGKARNYGWSRCEGTRRYPNTGLKCTFGTRPVHDYAHGNGRCSVTGGYVHRGPSAATWRGLYVAGDFCGRLFVLNVKGKVKLSKVTRKRISSFGEDADGRLLVTDLAAGVIYRVKMRGPRP
ncbi:MAG: PQQ-dependent sugar dehydrogenase [Chloroflexota bacterium]|jgi:glucose/arabinose dehydrogenase